MKRLMRFFLFVFLLSVCFVSLAGAEVLELKSGEKVEGKIIERTDDYVKIELNGIPLTYFSDQIASAEGEEEGGGVVQQMAPSVAPVTFGDDASEVSRYYEEVGKIIRMFDKAVVASTSELKKWGADGDESLYKKNIERLAEAIGDTVAALEEIAVPESVKDFHKTYVEHLKALGRANDELGDRDKGTAFELSMKAIGSLQGFAFGHVARCADGSECPQEKMASDEDLRKLIIQSSNHFLARIEAA